MDQGHGGNPRRMEGTMPEAGGVSREGLGGNAHLGAGDEEGETRNPGCDLCGSAQQNSPPGTGESQGPEPVRCRPTSPRLKRNPGVDITFFYSLEARSARTPVC